ncbi:MAG TPA: hypothetical protein VFR19_19060 [Hyphomicrobiaceae bacterium]|nr:hypothetical protein [Hyphomicrobiaceae bacterium]
MRYGYKVVAPRVSQQIAITSFAVQLPVDDEAHRERSRLKEACLVFRREFFKRPTRCYSGTRPYVASAPHVEKDAVIVAGACRTAVEFGD